MSCPLRMGCGALIGVQHRIQLPVHVPHLAERGVRDAEGDVVAGGFELGQCLVQEHGQLLGRALRLEEATEQALRDPGAQLGDAIARGRGSLAESARGARASLPRPAQ